MTNAINYEFAKAETSTSARAELETLLETLHQQGLLRLLTELLQASPELSEIMLSGLNRVESRNAVQNIALILMGLGRVPPERFAQLSESLSAACHAVQEHATRPSHTKAPGLIGVYKLLNDDELWQALQPLLEALKGLQQPLTKTPQSPAAEE